jgi:hypothetical protein
MTTTSAGRGSPRLLRRARLAALAVGGFLLPWCVLLAATLPATARAQDWSLAWTGLDAGEALAALSTAALLARADARAALTAAAGGALLLADAWFDVCTSAPGLDHALAMADALFVEVPLACAAFWLAARLTGAAAADEKAAQQQAPQRQDRQREAGQRQDRQREAPARPAADPREPGAEAAGQPEAGRKARREEPPPRGQDSLGSLEAESARAA